jgi:hypothetical protein
MNKSFRFGEQMVDATNGRGDMREQRRGMRKR